MKRIGFACLAPLCVASALFAAPRTARAETPPSPVAQARTHFERAVALYEEDDYRAALIEFNRAYSLAPSFQVLFNIGQSHYQLRDYANALESLERYLAEGGDKVPRDRRSQVDGELDELRGRVARLAVTANVDGAELLLDDAPLGRSPLPESAKSTLVSAGRHTVRAQKNGYATDVKTVDIAGGDEAHVAFELVVTPRAVSLSRPLEMRPSSSPSRAPAIAALAIGGAGVVVGTLFGVLAMHDKSALDDACRAKVCPERNQRDIDAFSRDGALSTVAFTVGAVGLVTGVLLYFTASPPRDASHFVGIGAVGRGLSVSF